eukprot:PhF_6_TR29385/c0_g1_i2/m.43328
MFCHFVFTALVFGTLTTIVHSIRWTDATELHLQGRPFPNNPSNYTYSRLPPNLQPPLVPKPLWEASLDSSGIFVEFESNSSAIHVQYTLRKAAWSASSSMPPTGSSGVDIYRFDTSVKKWRWVSTAFSGLSAATTNVTISPLYAYSAGWPVGPIPTFPSLNVTFRFRIHFPSLNGVTSMHVGVENGASLSSCCRNDKQKHLVWYGTSHAQGEITSRPGATFISRLGRLLNQTVINYGMKSGGCSFNKTFATQVIAAMMQEI